MDELFADVALYPEKYGLLQKDDHYEMDWNVPQTVHALFKTSTEELQTQLEKIIDKIDHYYNNKWKRENSREEGMRV